MNDLKLYESIPEKKFPIIMHDYQNIGYDFPPHWHENIEIHYIFEGEGYLRCQGKEIALSAGDCAIINMKDMKECAVMPVSFFRLLFWERSGYCFIPKYAPRK